MIQLIIVTVLAYACLKAALRRKPVDPATGRLVSRTGFQPLPMQRAAIQQILERERDLIDTHESACYRAQMVKLKLKFNAGEYHEITR
jgi:hypothetical protein